MLPTYYHIWSSQGSRDIKIIIPVLQKRKLRQRVLAWLAPGLKTSTN